MTDRALLQAGDVDLARLLGIVEFLAGILTKDQPVVPEALSPAGLTGRVADTEQRRGSAESAPATETAALDRTDRAVPDQPPSINFTEVPSPTPIWRGVLGAPRSSKRTTRTGTDRLPATPAPTRLGHRDDSADDRHVMTSQRALAAEPATASRRAPPQSPGAAGRSHANGSPTAIAEPTTATLPEQHTASAPVERPATTTLGDRTPSRERSPLLASVLASRPLWPAPSPIVDRLRPDAHRTEPVRPAASAMPVPQPLGASAVSRPAALHSPAIDTTVVSINDLEERIADILEAALVEAGIDLP